MELKHFFKLSVLFVAFFSFFNFVGFTGLERYVELENLVNARASNRFTKSSQNIMTVLSKGTQGEILESTEFKKSGNFGLKIKVTSGIHKNKVYWVYYNTKNPRLKLFKEKPITDSELAPSLATETKQVTEAQGARLTQDDRGYRDESAEARASLAPPRTSERKGISEDGIADLINRAVVAPSEISGSAIDTCIECRSTPASCNKKNDYIERELIAAETQGSPFLQKLLQTKSITAPLKKECVEFSQRTFPPNVRYGVCTDQNVISNGAKPCASDRLANLVTNSFNTVASCLAKNDNLMVESIFKMTTVESGFLPNPISAEGASGFGQFLPSAVKFVNNTVVKQIQQQLANSSEGDCRALGSYGLSDTITPGDSNRCTGMSIKNGNPAKNIIYTFALFQANKDYLQKEILGKSVFSSRLSLPKVELEKLMDSLARWSHNSGSGGMSRPLKVLLMQEFSSANPAKSANEIIKKLPQYMTSHPHPAYQYKNSEGVTINKPHAKEIANYFKKTENQAEQVRSSVGVNSCVTN